MIKKLVKWWGELSIYIYICWHSCVLLIKWTLRRLSQKSCVWPTPTFDPLLRLTHSDVWDSCVWPIRRLTTPRFETPTFVVGPSHLFQNSVIKLFFRQHKLEMGPTTNVGVSNLGVVKRRSGQTQESQTSEWVKRRSGSNVGVGQTQDFWDKRRSVHFISKTQECQHIIYKALLTTLPIL